MHLLFVDESGSPPKPTARAPKPYFVVAGVSIPDVQWPGIAKDFNELKLRFAIRGEIKWRYFGTENDDARNTLRKLSQTERDSFREQMIHILTQRKSVRIIACVASVGAAYETKYVTNPGQLYEYTYKPVTERFQYMLQDLSRVSGERHLGIIIADQRGPELDNRLKQHHNKLLFSTSQNTSKYQDFVEGLFLTESHTSVGIQFADVVAGAIGRKFNSHDDRWYREVLPAFRKSSSGTIDGFGLVKFPKVGWR